MATIKDIARLTGVSGATVSNVLNGRKGAAGPAKEREIFEVAHSLHYIPNSLAKSLKQRKTNNIGIITEDLTVFNTPEIVDGIDAYCEESGYEIILGNMRLFKRYNNDFTDTPQHQALLDTMVANMLAKQVEGIVYIGYHCREITCLPTMLNVPFTYAYCYPKQKLYPSVLFDDEGAAKTVVNILIQKGHKEIGFIAGPASSYHTLARLRGVQKALFENNMLFNAERVMYGDWERGSGYAHAARLIGNGVSALFCFNDLMASGAYEYCSDNGLAVGKDISLFGFDNREISQGYSPLIATVEPPLNEIGRKSAELVLAQLRNRKTPMETQLLACKVLERDSVCSIKG